jgi:DNA-binding response OmpR family regulator
MRGRILYVEDDGETRTIMQRLLSREGYHVATAQTRNEALTEAGKAKLDLLIVDLGLPDGSGLSLLSEARKLQPPVKGIVVSGYDIGQDVFDAGYAAQMLKPIEVPRLITLVETVLTQTHDAVI